MAVNSTTEVVGTEVEADDSTTEEMIDKCIMQPVLTAATIAKYHSSLLERSQSTAANVLEIEKATTIEDLSAETIIVDEIVDHFEEWVTLEARVRVLITKNN